MRRLTLCGRSLVHYRRTNLATLLCVGIGVTVLTGALLVGDSMRGSLRELALERLGPVDHAMAGRRFFREALADELVRDVGAGGDAIRICPIILLPAAAENAETAARAGRATLLGVDERFWRLDPAGPPSATAAADGRTVALSEPLARRLGVRPGDDVILRIGRPDRVPAETLLGRRDDTTVSLRLTVTRILSAGGLGRFGLDPTHAEPLNAYVPLATLQRTLKRAGAVNVLLAAGCPSSDDARRLQEALARHTTLHDVGLRLRRDDAHGCVVVESESLLIEPAAEAAVLAVARASGAGGMLVLTHLANTIAVESSAAPTPAPGGGAVPYSTVSAVAPLGPVEALPMTLTDGRPAPVPGEDEILLNEWAARELGAREGDRIRLSFYVPGAFGRLDTREAVFALRGVVRLEGTAADRGLTPAFEGVTDARHLSDWDPPFPIDLSRIREQDEAYWDHYGAAPKAFVALAAGERLWASTQTRFGRLTSVRLAAPDDAGLTRLAAGLERELLHRLPPEAVGLRFEPVRARAVAASAGSTDFAALFVAFSSFLIVAAALLIALTFRLGVERRASEIGLLLATGFSPRVVARLLLAEGGVIAAGGVAVGLAGAAAYGWLMLACLRVWWSGEVDASFLRLHAGGATLATGSVAGFGVAMLAMALAIRGVGRLPPRALLAGQVQAPAHCVRRSGMVRPTAVALTSAALALAFILGALTGRGLPQAAAFFASGGALLVAFLAVLAAWTRRPTSRPITGGGPRAIARVAVRNAVRNPLRTVLTAGLAASATFIIVAAGAGRRDAAADEHERLSGTGGFAWVAEAATPIQHDLRTPEGRQALGLSDAAREALAGAEVLALRLRDGDESSCANLYQPGRPRILGATRALIDRGGFVFRSSLARTDEERANPWRLLERPLPDGAVPAIGDYNTVLWLLRAGLGKDIAIADETGREVRLRFVALLSESILQGELVVAEPRLLEMFPGISGYSFFLVDAPASTAPRLRTALEHDLRAYGFEMTPVRERLRRYVRVENAYVTAFETLGGLGVVLGTLGLAAVLLRSALERRREMAILQALGYRRAVLRGMLMAESLAILLAGLVVGAMSAAIAIAPHLMETAALPALSSPLWILAGVIVTGVATTGVGARIAARGFLLSALREE